jgi:4-amino-4-deoxy-L-arabinose transferase-like glycosyltransferase
MMAKLKDNLLLLFKKSWFVFVIFLLLTLAVRWVSFFPSVIDWDESLYILIANSWLDGNTPYTQIWNNTPPGIYALFALALGVTGRAIVSVRIFACLFIAATGFFLYKTGQLMGSRGKKIGLLGGILYCIFSVTSGGMASNLELFFGSFVVLAFYLYFRYGLNPEKPKADFALLPVLIGFVLGIGFVIKYVAIFDFFALALIIAVTLFRQERSAVKYWKIVKTIFLMGTGFALPFLCFSFYFFLVGNFTEYLQTNILPNFLRTVNIPFSIFPPLTSILNRIVENTLLWLSIPIAVWYLVRNKTLSARTRYILSALLTSFMVVLICIVLVLRGDYYPHYFLHLLPVLCLVTAFLIIRLLFPEERTEHTGTKPSLILMVMLVLFFSSAGIFKKVQTAAEFAYNRMILGNPTWGIDVAEEISAYLKPKLGKDDYIYVVDTQPIIYFLTGARIPTRYPFPPHLVINKGLPNISGIDPLEELDRILAKNPRFIIRKWDENNPDLAEESKYFFQKLDRRINEAYKLEYSVEDVVICSLVTDAGGK